MCTYDVRVKSCGHYLKELKNPCEDAKKANEPCDGSFRIRCEKLSVMMATKSDFRLDGLSATFHSKSSQLLFLVIMDRATLQDYRLWTDDMSRLYQLRGAEEEVGIFVQEMRKASFV